MKEHGKSGVDVDDAPHVVLAFLQLAFLGGMDVDALLEVLPQTKKKKQVLKKAVMKKRLHRDQMKRVDLWHHQKITMIGIREPSKAY